MISANSPLKCLPDSLNLRHRLIMAAIICKALPRMLRILDLPNPPFMAKIYRDSSIDFIDLDK
jgi:hypothetical protein